MTAIDRTAYPRPSARLSREELGFRYDLTETDLTFVRANARGDNGRLLLAVLLKSRRDFGCFPGLGEVHAGIVVHVASQLGLGTRHLPTGACRRLSKLYRYQACECFSRVSSTDLFMAPRPRRCAFGPFSAVVTLTPRKAEWWTESLYSSLALSR